MAISTALIRDFVGAQASDDTVLESCLATANALLDEYLSANAMEGATPPDQVLDRARLEVAADLWHRRNAPNGILNQQYADVGGVVATPIRIGRDPLAPAYPLLALWVLPIGFA